jgi:hypothetical protein
MTKEIEEYKQKVEKLEKKVVHYKADMTNLFEFKVFTFELEEELHIVQKIMQKNLKEFKDHANQFLTYLEC